MNNASDLSWPERKKMATQRHHAISIDDDYFDVLDATFLEGRNLSRSFSSDDSTGVIINEAARTVLGGQSVAGREIRVGGKRRRLWVW